MRVVHAIPAENVHPAPGEAFQVSPAALVAASRAAREKGLGVVGAWHGHPRGPAALSLADEAGLRDAARAPSDGTAAPGPYAFLVSGRGAGRAPVLRGFVVGAGGEIAEAPVVAGRA